MKKILFVFVVIVFLFVLTGCRKHIDYGTVIDKSFSPAHKSYSPTVLYYNKRTHIIPRWVYHNDHWSLLVQNDDGQEWWDVSEDYYNSVDVGDSVDRKAGTK